MQKDGLRRLPDHIVAAAAGAPPRQPYARGAATPGAPDRPTDARPYAGTKRSRLRASISPPSRRTIYQRRLLARFDRSRRCNITAAIGGTPGLPPTSRKRRD